LTIFFGPGNINQSFVVSIKYLNIYTAYAKYTYDFIVYIDEQIFIQIVILIIVKIVNK